MNKDCPHPVLGQSYRAVVCEVCGAEFPNRTAAEQEQKNVQ